MWGGTCLLLSVQKRYSALPIVLVGGLNFLSFVAELVSKKHINKNMSSRVLALVTSMLTL